MPLVCLGFSHHSAPVEVRERHAVPAARITEALVALCDYETVREAVMVSTCNRMEIYAELNDYESGLEQLKAYVQNFRHGSVADIQSYLYTHLGHSAADHLFRVATGLDSMLIGEAEILGQLKSAYLHAQQSGTVGPTLHALFRMALQSGKRARSQTRIGEASLSVATAAVETAQANLPTLSGVRAVVIGAGKMGLMTARRLHAVGAGEITVVNRTLCRAQAVVDTIGAGNARELNDLAGSLATADVVITAAGAAHFMITPELIQEARRNANGRPLVIIDIAVPRDVDPDVATLPNIRLIDIDALRDVVEDRLDRRRAAIPQVERVIADVLERFSFWYRSRSAIAPVSQLAERAELLREAEIARLFARCPDLSERERRAIIGASKRMFSQLLHAPFAKIRSLTANDLPAALRLGRTLTTLFAATPPRVRARVLGQLPLLRFEQPRVESRYVAPKIAAGRDA